MRIFKQAFESIQGKKQEDEQKQQNNKGTFYIDEQFMTPEFLYKQNQQDGQQKKMNLTKQFFMTMSSIEHKFNSAPIKSITLVDQLVLMYQECVQQYDTMMDPIKYYFIDKIRNLIQQSDKFTERQPKSQQSSAQKLNPHQQTNEVSYFKDFEDFTDRIDKPTEYATPKAEEQFYEKENKLQQLRNYIEEGEQEQIKNVSNTQNKQQIQQTKQFPQKSQSMHITNTIQKEEIKKQSPKIEFRQVNNETPLPQLQLNEKEPEQKQIIDNQLQNQQKSIQDRLLQRQRSQKKKEI